MWWWFYQLAVDPSGAIYEYGYESPEPTGIIEYIKATETITIIKKAEKDFPDNNRTKEKFYTIVQEGFPKKRIIAIG